MTEAKQDDLFSVLIADHREVEQAFRELETGAISDPRQRRDLADHVIAELVRHSVAEEMYLYPTARKVLPDGDQIADQEIAEHAEAERVMKELDGMDATDARFDELLRTLMREIRDHIRGEENDLFPRLQAACDQEELRELGRKVTRAKQMAPTRPHPAAPDKPPANKLLAPGTGLVDRLRDALTGRKT
ncbi:Hemerythrin HHE cation binding domain-containing protein [Streptoalloteichus tenebrarius]|uniref:Hemerythrin HHE cation binding domain-containing protein n=1 Tax=Streptoalloteichus tenebrarius (strain ATCC 17920 / DSM 40477 / JCM 4838 / CBS 697.72 / NBRC 16177 / NCIMB 11028 / NRRL B-12390 / A12253. 1 / ISP 5477) TaxID=1933 RepID=A0ABT1I100_STRSD|nr:hemerythrin domain-containing protein [Streptoalloteichus tenebrarius]MCP2261457.1 Hemerythrin HHE cation binding domain-containing protein [Streptoalloteichus tenebrarius]BFE99692.1 hemerythrin domain-containing protein [Streptoalloteichus tenebrarius]